MPGGADPPRASASHALDDRAGRRLLLACLLGSGLCGCAGAAPPPHLAEIELGETELALGQPAAALRHYSEARRLAPQNARALRGIALAQLDLRRPHEALQAFHELERTAPQSFDRELRAARCGALELAVEHDLDAGESEQAIRLAVGPASRVCPEARRAPLGTRTLRRVAEQARGNGSVDEALAAYRALLAREPGDPEAALFAARSLLADGRRDEAIELLSDALLHEPEDRRLIELMVSTLAGR